jgi:membrane dipeptidase
VTERLAGWDPGAVPASAITAPESSLLWEQHSCLPLTAEANVGELARYARSGGAYVSVNVGYAPHDAADVLALIARFRAQICRDARLELASTVDDVDAAHQAGRTVVAFDLEDSGPLDGDLDLVQRFYELGVRSLLPTYNTRNRAGSGCLDAADEGLTGYGRDLVARMNEVGMLVDGSHCSSRTGLDLCEASRRPVIYSHSCMRAVWDHPRNISDEQALACAATGGVIGIAGVGIFLGPNTATLEAMVQHIDHAVSLVGPEHVGVGSDYPFDFADFNRELAQNPHLFPAAYTSWGPIGFVPPETLLRLGMALRDRGYPSDAITAILGGNFRRVAGQSWASATP